jgi:hypothetical protein
MLASPPLHSHVISQELIFTPYDHASTAAPPPAIYRLPKLHQPTTYNSTNCLTHCNAYYNLLLQTLIPANQPICQKHMANTNKKADAVAAFPVRVTVAAMVLVASEKLRSCTTLFAKSME